MSLGTRSRQAEVPPAVRERARQAADWLGPMAKTAQRGAAERVHGARTWAAPRIEQAAHSVQHDVGPKVSSMLVATAQRVEPTKKSAAKLGRRARGKTIGGLAIVVAALGAVAAVVIRRRNNGAASDAAMTDQEAAAGAETQAEADALDGQVRTP